MKLTIRKMMDQDLEPLCVLLSDPDVMRFLEPPYSNEQLPVEFKLNPKGGGLKKEAPLQ